MNGIYNPIVFYPAAVAMLLFAVLAIKFKNIFYSLLSAIMVFFAAGMFFYVLGSEYNAVIQIAIYGLAVPVILAVAIMFTDFRQKKEHTNTGLKFAIYLTGGVFILSVIYLILISLTIVPAGFNIAENAGFNPLGAMPAFAEGIFVRYVWAFELVSLILTIIVAGLTIFKKETLWKK